MRQTSLTVAKLSLSKKWRDTGSLGSTNKPRKVAALPRISRCHCLSAVSHQRGFWRGGLAPKNQNILQGKRSTLWRGDFQQREEGGKTIKSVQTSNQRRPNLLTHKNVTWWNRSCRIRNSRKNGNSGWRAKQMPTFTVYCQTFLRRTWSLYSSG